MPVPRFDTTQWSEIRRARDRDPARLDEIARRYWAPIYNFIHSRGIPPSDAEDLAQETFLEIFRDGFLERADRAKGRFRSLLLAVTKHVLAHASRGREARKRGGGTVRVPLDADLPSSVGDLRDEAFDRLWARDLVRCGLEALRQEDEREGRLGAQALRMHALEAKTYEAIAKTLSAKIGDVRNAIHRARTRLKSIVRTLISQYVGSREEFEDEVAYLERLMASGGS